MSKLWPYGTQGSDDLSSAKSHRSRSRKIVKLWHATLNSHWSPNFLVRLMTYCFRKHYKTPTMPFNPTYQNVLNFAIISEIAHTINY